VACVHPDARRILNQAEVDVPAVADVFIVYNHNIRSIVDRWRLDSNQLLIELQYAWRL